MTQRVSRRHALYASGVAIISGTTGCLSSLNYPDLRLRNFDTTAHTLFVEISRPTHDTIVLSDDYTLGRKTVDTTIDECFPEPGTYEVRASFDDEPVTGDTWQFETDNPKYHVTIQHLEDEGAFINLGRLGGF